MSCLRFFPCAVLLALGTVSLTSKGQEVQSAPGQFDYYVLNLSWSPAFCDTMKTLSPQERVDAGQNMECAAPHAFVLHGLWPQNNDGTYPASCSNRQGPQHPERNLDMTPSLPLLKHEWSKHGTCTTLSPEAFFATARQAYTSVTIPEFFTSLDHQAQMTPDQILGLLYKSNADFPQGSFALSCGNNQLTAVEACFDKDVHPIACTSLKTCHANSVRIVPENAGGIVQ